MCFTIPLLWDDSIFSDHAVSMWHYETMSWIKQDFVLLTSLGIVKYPDQRYQTDFDEWSPPRKKLGLGK